MNKIIYIVLDGLGDLPCKELDNKTPLEAAATPNLDSLAGKGKLGLMYSVGKGIAPESDIAVISLLGYDAHKYYTGRGPLESYAEGLAVNDGDLAFRVNFATVGGNNKIIDRRVGRSLSTEEAAALCREINTRIKLTSVPAGFEFKNTIGHRGILVIRSKEGNLSGDVTNTDPAYEKEGVFGVAKPKFENIALECRPVEGYEGVKEAEDAASLTNEFIQKSHEVLEAAEINKKRQAQGKLSANLILARDGGNRLPKFPCIRERFGRRFGSFVEMPVEKGIALLTGMEVVELPEPTGKPEADYPLRAKMVLEMLQQFDGLYVHLKGPDEPAHDGDSKAKKRSIEDIDKFFFAHLLAKVDIKNNLLAVTADHSTPCSLHAHSDDPVPLLVTGCGMKSDGINAFSERLCREGSLGTILGNQLMPLLIKVTA